MPWNQWFFFLTCFYGTNPFPDICHVTGLSEWFLKGPWGGKWKNGSAERRENGQTISYSNGQSFWGPLGEQ